MKLLTISGLDIYQDPTDGGVTFSGEACIDADGSPRAYGPNDTGLDYTANAGHLGNWWALVTDLSGNPVIQGEGDPAPGFYVSTTSLVANPLKPKTSPLHWVNSEEIPYIVVPGPLARAAQGVVLGCHATITDSKTRNTIAAVVADIGPATHLGEMSIAAAKALGLNHDAKNGGCSEKHFFYTFYPNRPAHGFKLQPLG